MVILGISANSHDAAITVVKDQEILFASQSERYSGIKNDAHLNFDIIEDAKQHGKPDVIVWYEQSWKKSMRQIRAGQGFNFFSNEPDVYLRKYNIDTPVTSVGHHHSHAAGGYYTSPYQEAAVLVIDAIGEFDTTSIWHGKGKKLEKKFSIGYPHSLGLWYSAMTQRVGLKPNEEEYILMGMAAYGDPLKYTAMILEDFFDSKHMLKLNQNLHRGCMWWRPELNTEQDKYDIAAATQFVYEMCFHDLLDEAKNLTGSKNLVLGGGCALNCVANSIAFQYFENVWIMPNPGDAGSSLGAIAAYQQEFLKWNGPYLGYDIKGSYPTEKLIDILITEKIAGVASGKAEFGPRALGHRSLLADPRGDDIKDKVNAIKKRQKFRPFAPAILAEHAHEYFHMPTTESPYMQYTAVCKHPLAFPAIIHADGTSRVQTVSKSDSPDFYNFLKQWYQETGCPMILNTSLNIKGKPMVNTTDDAKKFEETYQVKVV
jgi:carbamoyltransferase